MSPDGQKCPCGEPVGVDQPGVIYYHVATGRQFCSCHCSTKWHERFWKPYCEHVGRKLSDMTPTTFMEGVSSV